MTQVADPVGYESDTVCNDIIVRNDDRVALHQQCHYAAHVKANASHWPYMVSVWRPSGTRRVGRPRQRWDDYLLNFAQRRFNVNHWLDVPAANWHLYADEYVQSIVD